MKTLEDIVEYLNRAPKGRAVVTVEKVKAAFRTRGFKLVYLHAKEWADKNGLTMTTDNEKNRKLAVNCIFKRK